mmetsp:Transcript_9075/g.15222  ORF Transcript_9075/g.15222 Transcript_9075/m.15222 type:complete len:91 (+) Transcript_9075:586-858(+)
MSLVHFQEYWSWNEAEQSRELLGKLTVLRDGRTSFGAAQNIMPTCLNTQNSHAILLHYDTEQNSLFQNHQKNPKIHFNFLSHVAVFISFC